MRNFWLVEYEDGTTGALEAKDLREVAEIVFNEGILRVSRISETEYLDFEYKSIIG